MPKKIASDSVERAISQLLLALKQELQRDGLRATPQRVAAAYSKIFEGYDQDPHEIVKTFDASGYDEMIVVRDIEFYSTCEHHLLPFFGTAHIGYIPRRKIIGLSKIPRVVEIFSRRLQNQERLTVEIATTLQELIAPKGVGVVLEAKHLCMMARGVKKQGSMMITSAMRGIFKSKFNTRHEFLRLIHR